MRNALMYRASVRANVVRNLRKTAAMKTTTKRNTQSTQSTNSTSEYISERISTGIYRQYVLAMLMSGASSHSRALNSAHE